MYTRQNTAPVTAVPRMENKMHSFVPDPTRTTDLRRALGQFGTGVALMTAQTEVGPLGMTANSFSSVSLEPPLVLWSAARSSKRHDAFVKAKSFCIHVLSAEQRDVAQHFAAQGHDFSPTPLRAAQTARQLCMGVWRHFTVIHMRSMPLGIIRLFWAR